MAKAAARRQIASDSMLMAKRVVQSLVEKLQKERTRPEDPTAYLLP